MLIKFSQSIFFLCELRLAGGRGNGFSKVLLTCLKLNFIRKFPTNTCTTLFCRLFHHATSFKSWISVCFISHYFVGTPDRESVSIILFQFWNDTKITLKFSRRNVSLLRKMFHVSHSQENPRVLSSDIKIMKLINIKNRLLLLTCFVVHSLLTIDFKFISKSASLLFFHRYIMKEAKNSTKILSRCGFAKHFITLTSQNRWTVFFHQMTKLNISRQQWLEDHQDVKT